MGPLLALKWQTPVQTCLNIYMTRVIKLSHYSIKEVERF